MKNILDAENKWLKSNLFLMLEILKSDEKLILREFNIRSYGKEFT